MVRAQPLNLSPLRPSGRFTVSRQAVPKCALGETQDDEDDGGDGFFGTPQEHSQSMGIGMPPGTTHAEIDYINGGKNAQERMSRLKEIARKRNSEMINEKMRRNIAAGVDHAAGAADLYMKQLSKASTQKATEQQEEISKMTKDDHYEAGLAGKNKADLYFEQLQVSRSTSENAKPRADMIETALRGSRAIEDVEPELKPEVQREPEEEPEPEPADLAPVAEPQSEHAEAAQGPEDVATTPAPSAEVTARQIAFLEQHLAKLESEAMEESSTTEVGDSPDPKDVRAGLEGMSDELGSVREAPPTAPTPPLGDGMGEMSEDAVRAAFDEVRAQQQAASSGAEAPSGPALGDGMGDMSEEETRAAMEQIRAERAAMADAPSADPYNVVLPTRSESGSSSSEGGENERVRLALIAARIETTRFIEAQQEALKEYEENLQDIYQKYVPEMD